MNCKNCGHNLVEIIIFNPRPPHKEFVHSYNKTIAGELGASMGYVYCYHIENEKECGCNNPEPEKEAKK